MANRGLKAAELISHPAFKNLKWKLPPAGEGYAEVAKGRGGGPFKLWYEVHGKGATRIVVSGTLAGSTSAFDSV
jgi:hypothetical protein